MELTLGSIEELSNLYRASTIELIRRFSAKKLQEDRYLIPPEKIPWYTVVDLGEERPLLCESGVLYVESISIEPAKLPSHIDLAVGFLVRRSDLEYLCLGALVTGRTRVALCHSRTYTQPFDLWDFPRNIQVPTLIFIGRETSRTERLRVTVPLDCVREHFPELLSELTRARTRYLIILTDFVSLVGKVKIKIEDLSVGYTWTVET